MLQRLVRNKKKTLSYIADLSDIIGMDESLRLPPRLAAILEDLPLEELAFTPVPVKPRRDGWTPERQLAFILRLALLGGVAAAAKAVGMSRESAYRLPTEGPHDPDPAGTLRRLLDEIDPGGAERPSDSNDFPPRFA
jgi:hypothetical protein